MGRVYGHHCTDRRSQVCALARSYSKHWRNMVLHSLAQLSCAINFDSRGATILLGSAVLLSHVVVCSAARSSALCLPQRRHRHHLSCFWLQSDSWVSFDVLLSSRQRMSQHSSVCRPENSVSPLRASLLPTASPALAPWLASPLSSISLDRPQCSNKGCMVDLHTLGCSSPSVRITWTIDRQEVNLHDLGCSSPGVRVTCPRRCSSSQASVMY
jgi:hypothetical protein